MTENEKEMMKIFEETKYELDHKKITKSAMIKEIILGESMDKIRGRFPGSKAAELLKNAHINYIGYIEGDEIYQGLADVTGEELLNKGRPRKLYSIHWQQLLQPAIDETASGG